MINYWTVFQTRSDILSETDFPLEQAESSILHTLHTVCWPAHPDYPQGIRVASVIEFSVCLSVLCSLF